MVTVQKTYQNGQKTRLHTCTIDYMWVHRQFTNAQLRKSSLPSLYPLRYSCEKLLQSLYHFFILQVTESWAGPGNKASDQLRDTNCMSLNLIPKPLPFFVLRFLFSIIHRSGRSGRARKTGKAREHLSREWCLVNAR